MILHRQEGYASDTGVSIPYSIEVTRTPRIISNVYDIYSVFANVKYGEWQFRTLVLTDPLEALEEGERWIQERRERRPDIFWSSSERYHKDYIVREGYLKDNERYTDEKQRDVRFGAVAYYGEKRLKAVKSYALWDAGGKVNDWIDEREPKPVATWLEKR